MNTSVFSYVLITPARNEEHFIERTIESVIAQTLRPVKWVIVSDGSTDRTEEIVRRYVDNHPWIELLHMPERKERHFAGKVMAFNAGYARVGEISYNVIASLDADIWLPASDYFEFLLQKLDNDPALGLVGTPFEERSTTYDYRFVNIEHVSGACQVFRRECFEQIGGYVPVKGGGIDHIAVMSARMKGWKTRTFTERTTVHSREMGTAEDTSWRARLKQGQKDYVFGYHPVWELFRTAYQMTRQPLVLGGLLLAAGYLGACLRRSEHPISMEMIEFQRREQLRRLKQFVLREQSGQRNHLAIPG